MRKGFSNMLRGRRVKTLQGDPVTLQCFVFVCTISGAVEPAAVFQNRSAASLVGIQAADQNFGKTEAFAVRLHIFQHPGGIAFSAFRRADGVADVATVGAQKIVQVVAHLNHADKAVV